MTFLRTVLIGSVVCAAGAAGAVSALAADWPQPGYDSGQTGHSPEERVVDSSNVARLHQVWQGAGGRGVVVADSRIFVSGLRWTPFGLPRGDLPRLFVYERGTHRLLWRTDVVYGVPAVSGGVAYVASPRGVEAYAVDCAGGGGLCAPLWRAPLDEGHFGPAVAGDEVYVRTPNNLLAYPTDCSTPCSPAWRGDVGRGFDPPAARNGVAYVTSEDLPGLYAFPAHCATGGARCDPLWTGVVDGVPLANTSPAAGEEAVVLHTYVTPPEGGTLSRIVVFPANCAAVCAPRWYADVPWQGSATSSERATTPAVGQGMVFVALGPELRAYPLDCGTGGASCEPLWVSRAFPAMSPSEPSYFLGSPSVANGVVYASGTGPNGSDRIWAFSARCRPEGCDPLWSVPSGRAEAAVRPAIADGRLYLAANGTYEFALDGIRPRGALEQPVGSAGCVSRFGQRGCGRARGLAGVADVAVSPDGRFVYAAARKGRALVALARDAGTGALTQLRGEAGCITSRDPARDRCASAPALGRPKELELSPDGRHLYAVGLNDVIPVFRRDHRTGALAQLPGRQACMGPRTGCRRLRGVSRSRSIRVGELVFDPTGRHLYLRGPNPTVRLLHRDRETGVLRQPRSKAACLAGTEAERLVKHVCRRTSAFGGFFHVSLAMSADGRHLYVGSDQVTTFGASLAVFRRDPRSGLLRRVRGRGGCVAHRDDRAGRCLPQNPPGDPVDLSLGPGGRVLYALEKYAGSPVRLRMYRRSPRTGSIRPVRGEIGCLSDSNTEGCRLTDSFPRAAPVFPRGGRAAYANAGDGVLVFHVGNRGELLPLPGEWACLGPLPDPKFPFPGRCTDTRALRGPTHVASSPDGRHLYVSTRGNSIAVLEPRLR